MKRSAARRALGQAGQSMVEYLVVAIVLTALIAVPIEGSASAIELLMKAIHTAYTNFLTALSLPN